MKVCSKCKKEKPLDEFYNSAKRGKQYWCKRCANSYRWNKKRTQKQLEAARVSNRASYQRNKVKYLQRISARNAAIKLKAIQFLGNKCNKCGFDHPAALEFHHIDPTLKLFDIGKAIYAPKNTQKIK